MTQFETVTRRTQFILPSQNLRADEAEDRRQLVMVIFSQGSAGPNQFIE